MPILMYSPDALPNIQTYQRAKALKTMKNNSQMASGV